MQTVLEILDKCSDYFSGKGVPNAKIDAQMLLASVLGCKRLELFLRFDQPLSASQLSDFRELAKRRAKREPLQHILGEVEFFGLKLRSDRRALIPRFETEELCEISVETLFPDRSANIRILDLGTGSGAIACAFASVYKNADIVAVDKSPDALSLARENAELNSLKNISFMLSDWFDGVDGRFDLIATNPPYLSEADVASAEPEVRNYDPKSALVSADGGIADGRGIAAAFMLGAEGVQMGTHFVVTNESQVHENYKDMIIKARDIDSRVTGRSTGHPVRALRNQMTKEYLQKEQEGAPFEELELLTLGGLRRAVVDGDVKTGSVMAGQIAGMVKEKMSCHDLIQKLVKETDDLIGGKGFYE